MEFEKLREEIKEHEGYQSKAYQLKYGNTVEPFYTIGYGHRIQPTDNIEIDKVYPHKEIEKWFEVDFSKARRSADDLLGECHPLAKEVGIEACYVLGKNGFSKFKQTIQLIKDKQFIEASEEIKNSKWYRQVPHRVEMLSRKLQEI